MIHLQITILAVGSLKNGPEYDLVLHYKKRLPSATIIEVKASTMEGEARAFEKLIKPTDYLMGLDERGKHLTSQDFAEALHTQSQHYKRIVCIIGGACGLSPRFKKRCHMLLCLGTMTWPHMLVRPLIMEQLYRAHTLLNNHPYHRI